MSKNNSKKILLILLVFFWPAGLIYYFIKRKSINEANERNWFLNRPFLSWLIVLFVIIFFVVIFSSIEQSKISDMGPEQKEQYLLEQKSQTLTSNIKTMLSFDGVANDERIMIQKIDYTNASPTFILCTDSKGMVSTIEIDITDKTTGAIDKFVGDDFTWGLDAAKTTFKRLYTDTYNEEYRENIGVTILTFKKTPESTIDKYGNEIKHTPVNIGIIALCSSTENKINWKNMDNLKLKELVLIEWSGSEGTGLGDRLQKISDNLMDLQNTLNSLD